MSESRAVLGKYVIIFCIFFILSLGLGYAILNRYDPVALGGGLHDLRYYADIVRDGPAFFVDEPLGIRTRLLSPWFAHLLYTILPTIGSYNSVSVAMLVANSFFTAASALLIFNCTFRFFRDSNVAIIASFIFITSFYVTNSYLVGSVDAVYGLFFLIMYCALVRDKWFLLPIIMIFGCLAKEAFLPVGAAFVLFTLIHRVFEFGRLPLAKIVIFVTMVISGFVTIVCLNALVYGSMTFPWSLIPDLEVTIGAPKIDFSLTNFFIGLIRFVLILGLLVWLSLYSLKRFPSWFLAGNFGTLLITVSLAVYIGVSGADYARFMFSPLALLLCSASALTIFKLKINA